MRWKRSDLTTGEYYSLQRSHKGLTQALNTRYVSHYATHTSTHRHTNLTKDLSLCLLVHTHKLYILFTVIGISPQFATLHQNDDCRCSGFFSVPCQQLMQMRQDSYVDSLWSKMLWVCNWLIIAFCRNIREYGCWPLSNQNCRTKMPN